MKGKNIFKIFLTFIIAFSLSLSAFADTKSDLNKTLNEKNKIKQNINKSEKDKDITEKEKKNIDNRVLQLSDKIDDISDSLSALNNDKEKIEKELEEAEEKKEKQEKMFKKRLRSIYEDGALSYINVLLSSDSIFDFFYNIELLKQISEHDDKVLSVLEESEKKIEAKKKELNTLIAKESDKKNELKIAESNLKSESIKKENYMKSLEKDIDAYKKLLDDLEREENALRAEIARQAANQNKNSGTKIPTEYTGGKFAWPAPGVHIITCPFGMRKHPITGVYKLHTGTDIGTPMGSNVVAAADGVVVISGNHRAYGKYVSINHGGGIVTLYAHNSKLLVSAGQKVKRGQVIAKSGSTGYSTGPHLHFEVMINGKPVNPMSYFN